MVVAVVVGVGVAVVVRCDSVDVVSPSFGRTQKRSVYKHRVLGLGVDFCVRQHDKLLHLLPSPFLECLVFLIPFFLTGVEDERSSSRVMLAQFNS